MTAQNGGRDIRFAQITDCHLFADADGVLRGVRTHDSFSTVLDDLKRFMDRDGPVDVVLATGDLSQDETAESYRRFADLVSKLGVPVYAIPGNHDAPKVMNQVFGENGVRVARGAGFGAWHLVFLDSQIDGDVDGRLDAAELSALEDELDANADCHVLVAVHHHPVRVGPWGRHIALLNADEMFAILDRHDNARAVLWGHVHQAFDDTRGPLRLLATPSTCFPVRRTDDGAYHVDPPAGGYRLGTLHADGTITTEVVDVPAISQ
jgi:Icc protein